jgi:hypothetical protein
VDTTTTTSSSSSSTVSNPQGSSSSSMWGSTADVRRRGRVLHQEPYMPEPLLRPEVLPPHLTHPGVAAPSVWQQTKGESGCGSSRAFSNALESPLARPPTHPA